MPDPSQKDTGSTFEPFNRDVSSNEGYLYTTNSRLSSKMANGRISDATFAAIDMTGKSVLDIGCGDGTYTIELFDRGKPSRIVGIDPADKAIDAARTKIGSRSIELMTGSAYELPFADASFDVAHIRGVLHHMDRPATAIKEALRVASRIVIIEPNGYSPVLKLLERVSRYHIEHEEKSYFPFALDRWVRELSGTVVSGKFAGLVPMFCPDWFARGLKVVEPVVESLPLLRAVSCAVYVQVSARG